MESQSDQQEQLRSRVQDLGSIFKGLVVALGLPLGARSSSLPVFNLVAACGAPLHSLVFVVTGAARDLETAAGARIGLVIIALIPLWRR